MPPLSYDRITWSWTYPPDRWIEIGLGSVGFRLAWLIGPPYALNSVRPVVILLTTTRFIIISQLPSSPFVWCDSLPI